MQLKDYAVLANLLPYVAEHKRSIWISSVLACFLTVSTVVRPLILKQIIDVAVPSKDYSGIGLWSGLFLALVIFNVAINYRLMLNMAGFGLNVIRSLKSSLFHKLLHRNMSFYDKTKTGWLISRVESDTDHLKNFFSNVMIRLIVGLLTFCGVLVMLYQSDSVIASGLTIVCLMLGISVVLFMKQMRKLYDKARSCYADLTGFISEYIHGIPVIQAYHREQKVLDKLKQVGRKRYVSELKVGAYEYGFWSVFTFFSETVLISVILYFGIPKVLSDQMSLGTLVMLLEYCRQMTWPLISFSENFNEIQRAVVVSNRVFSLINDESSQENSSENAINRNRGDIHFKNVWFSYNDKDWVLQNFNLSVKFGEKIALVGPSGSGKTTITGLLCKFYEPQKGSIAFANEPLQGINPSLWRRNIGLVLQDVVLFPGTVLDNLRVLDKTVSREQVEFAARTIGAHEFICSLEHGYDTVVQENGNNLSQGEKQLLSFTRALVQNPKVLVLDEATASMDPATEHKLQKSLETLMEGRTSFIVAHRLSTIQNVDRILAMKDGVLVECGSHDELIIKQGLYSQLLSLQQEAKLIA
jgi:ATP-binding cassette subfamily B protein